jgi:hypothetical protein
MAWDVELVAMLRVMIFDLESPYRFSDTNLKKVILTSSQMVNMDVEGLFAQAYVPDIINLTLIVDPTLPESRNNDYINLLLLKSGCFVDNANARLAARKGGVAIKEFGSSLDTRGIWQSAMKILEQGWCKNYNDALFAFQAGNSSTGTAILSPFRTIWGAGNSGHNHGTGGYDLFSDRR